jgi:hypothetical protein
MGPSTVVVPSILDAIIAGSGAALRLEPPKPAVPLPPVSVAPSPAVRQYSAPIPPAASVPAAPGFGLEAKRAVARSRFFARQAEAEAPRPPAGAEKALHCPICRTGSRNRQGVVSHLRQIHHLDKPARDSAMAAGGI